MAADSNKERRETKTPDLTGFASLLGESLSSRVRMLDRLLQNAHYPSIGQYKERLLAETIRGYLPATVAVGTGFVLFPREEEHSRATSPYFDPLNQSAYVLSKQCDLLVFDPGRHPPIFRDGDFVVLRPEAVRAVIEVKGSLSSNEVKATLTSMHDFALKWRATQVFYKAHHQKLVDKPALFGFAWDYQRNAKGLAGSNPRRLCVQVANFYRENLDLSSADAYPYLNKLLVHNECEIGAVFGMGGPKGGMAFGMYVSDGRFFQLSADGKLQRGQDRTVASLLASLHHVVAPEDFNRFFSYMDEVRHNSDPDDPMGHIEWILDDLSTDQSKSLARATLL